MNARTYSWTFVSSASAVSAVQRAVIGLRSLNFFTSTHLEREDELGSLAHQRAR